MTALYGLKIREAPNGIKDKKMDTPLVLHARLELDELDSDLREAFEALGINNFAPGLPTKIQLNRLLRQILLEIK